MLSVATLVFERNQKPNRHAFHDVGLAVENLIIQGTALGLFVHQMAGLAVENLIIQGTALGLFVHQMAGFHTDRARETYGIPEGYDPVAAMVIGYRAVRTRALSFAKQSSMGVRSGL